MLEIIKFDLKEGFYFSLCGLIDFFYPAYQGLNYELYPNNLWILTRDVSKLLNYNQHFLYFRVKTFDPSQPARLLYVSMTWVVDL